MKRRGSNKPVAKTAGRLALALVAAGALTATTLAAPNAAAQSLQVRESFQVSGWRGEAVYSGNAFRYCWIYSARNNQAGIRLAFMQNPSNALFLAVSKDDWRMNPGSNYRITVKVDDSSHGEFRGTVYQSDKSQAIFPLGQRPRLFQALRAGRTLSLVNSSRRYNFALRGTSNALARMRHCVNVHTGRVQRRPDSISEAPFGQPDPDDRHINGPFGANDMQSLAEVMDGAGYRLVADSERQENWPGTYHVWRGDDRILGALISTGAEAGQSADDKYEAYIERLRYSCRGTLSAAVYSRTRWDGAEVIRAIAACEENGKSYVLPLTVISHDAGAVIAVHFGGAEARATLYEADNRLVQALRSRYGS